MTQRRRCFKLHSFCDLFFKGSFFSTPLRQLLTCLVGTCIVLTGMVGCAPPKGGDEQTPLAELGYVNVDLFPAGNKNINNIRLQALRETAVTIGAQGALAWQSIHINRSLDTEASYLDQVFNFSQLLLKNNVLPPVISESSDNLNLTNTDTIRTANKTYRIIFPARFATNTPTWRDYLLMNYKKPDVPNNSLLPVDQAEAQVWNFYLKQGWKNGVEQANNIFAANVNRLKRDYLGMNLYRKLVAQGIISSPVVAKAELGITGNSEEIRINDAIIRITAHAQLQPDSTHWKPVLTKGSSSAQASSESTDADQ